MGRVLKGLLDSGSCFTILGKNGLDLIEELKLYGQPTTYAIKTADGTIHPAVCTVPIPYLILKKVRVVNTLVIPSLPRKLILGVDFWKAFGIQPKFNEEFIIDCDLIERVDTGRSTDRIDLSDEQETILTSTIESFLVSKEGYIGCSNKVKHNIDTESAKPIVKRSHPISPYIQKELDCELNRMLKLDVIEKSNSPWANPIVVVKKSNGKIRMCLDARGLNSVTVKDAYPLPHIGRILAQIPASKFLSSLDLSDAFWQIALDDSSKLKTAFNVPGRGHFQFKRLPFGLCNSAQTLCRALDNTIGTDLEPNVFVYIDDIIVVSETFDQHIELLNEIAKRLKNAGFSISSEKSKFCVKELKYLGYILTENGLKMDPERVSPILNLPVPKNIRDVRRIMGMAGWYRRFIDNFSDLTAPITDLLKSNKKKFEWTNEADKAFMKLKSALVSSPILCSPNYDEIFTIQTDASNVGMGAVLTQGEGKGEKVIAYMSSKLTTAQQKYTTTERECLAVLEAIKKFRNYIEGTKFRVITDHASLLWLRNLKDPTSRLSRWALRLQEFEFDLIHRKGKLNVVPDALSRSVEVIDMFEIDAAVDDEYLDLKRKITKFPNKYPNFSIKNDQIFKHCALKTEIDNEDAWKLYVPAKDRAELFGRMHDNPLSGHMGFRKTLKRIQENYYWPKMVNHVKHYVKTCSQCQSNKHPTQAVKVPIGIQKETDGPWETIAVDFMGPFPRSRDGNRYVLVVVDIFSKFVFLKPMRQADTKTMVKYLENDIFLIFGVPKKIVADNGPQFRSKLFLDLLKQYNIQAQFNAAYHPQHNPAERINRVVLSSLRAYIDEDQKNWDKEIHKIACAIRTSRHDSTGFTPFEVNFGKKMEIDGNRLDRPIDKSRSCSAPVKIEKIRQEVKKKLKSSYEKYAKNYNLRTKPTSFEVGESVLKKSFLKSCAVDGFNAKLAPQYVKCKIREKLGSCTYLIENLNGKVIGRYHANDLRKFNERDKNRR